MKFEVPLYQYFQRNNEYSAAHKGMRYFLSPTSSELTLEDGTTKKEKHLTVTIWPEPWALQRTDPALRMTRQFPFTEEGRTDAIAWLEECYQAEYDRWQECPSILDSEPWYPAPPEPETEE